MLTKLLILLGMLPFCAVILAVLYGFLKVGGRVGADSGRDSSSGGSTGDGAGASDSDGSSN